MPIVFGDFDASDFWKQSEYARKEYTDVAPDDLKIARVEAQLGYTLPPAYVELARVQNGGMPNNTCHRTRERTSWAHDHVAITGIYSIGNRKRCSLGSGMGSQFMIDEWGYPPIGVYFADCPSAGHDMICLDYRSCGPLGEPQVVHVDQEFDYKITFLEQNPIRLNRIRDSLGTRILIHTACWTGGQHAWRNHCPGICESG